LALANEDFRRLNLGGFFSMAPQALPID
jgi:hypothetical protein